MGGSSFRWPIRFYRSAAVNSPHATMAWYLEFFGRGWHIEIEPIRPHLWEIDLSKIADAE